MKLAALRCLICSICEILFSLLAPSYCAEYLTEAREVLVDAGYPGKPFADAVETVKRNELHTFEVQPKHWIAELSFVRLKKCHRLWKNCEHPINNKPANNQSGVLNPYF